MIETLIQPRWACQELQDDQRLDAAAEALNSV